ncbi:MAG: DUF4142 domain-containing protein [Acidobacteriota bacterium]|nr:DUF4142 domain-containing protein [Acidobacteriota bacterium]
MNTLNMRVAVIEAVLVGGSLLLPVAMVAQTSTDPNGNPAVSGGVNPPVTSQPNPPVGPLNGTGSSAPIATGSGSMASTLGAPGATGQQMQDKQFLMEAAQGNAAEVQLGMLATQKGGPEVKEFGQKMVEDHAAINKDIATIADEMGVMLPKKISREHQAEYEKLNGLSGDEFDKEYIACMLKDHRQDMHAFRMEAASAADPNLQAEVVKAGAVIRQHMQMAVKLAEEKGVPVPPRPQRPPAAK